MNLNAALIQWIKDSKTVLEWTEQVWEEAITQPGGELHN